MLLPYRRFWLILMAGLLVAPAAVHLSSSGKSVSLEEGRLLASLPGIPKSRKEAKDWFTRFDAYLNDHFGFRDPIIRLHAWINQATSNVTGNASVLRGDDGWMFYRGGSMLEQSSGRIMRAAQTEHAVSVLADMEALLSARGSKLIVASPRIRQPSIRTRFMDGRSRSGRRSTICSCRSCEAAKSRLSIFALYCVKRAPTATLTFTTILTGTRAAPLPPSTRSRPKRASQAGASTPQPQ